MTSTPKEPSVLDRWEAEANSTIEQAKHPAEIWGLDISKDKRILALIDLVRKIENRVIQHRDYCLTKPEGIDLANDAMKTVQDIALALTENLK